MQANLDPYIKARHKDNTRSIFRGLLKKELFLENFLGKLASNHLSFVGDIKISRHRLDTNLITEAETSFPFSPTKKEYATKAKDDELSIDISGIETQKGISTHSIYN